MNRLAVQLAASTLAITATMVGCSSNSAVAQLVTAGTARSDVQAARLHDQARQAMERGETAQALTLVERVVEMAPRDAGYRLLLAELYLRNGRFRSAEAGFRDVLQLHPDNMRAAISLALVEVAQGRSGEAVEQLAQLHGRAPASDLGLAYALAGQYEQAISILDAAARDPGANARVRQNLALAYALAGNWQQARVIAAQDISPAELGSRLQQWAAMARPAQPWTQVASLLNVTPSEDPGQPVHLALAPAAPEAPVYAEAAPVQAAVEQPVALAAAAPAPAEQQVAFAAVEPAAAQQPVELAAADPAPVAQPEPYVVPQVPVQLAAAAPAQIQVPAVPAPMREAPTPAQEEIRTAAALRSLVQARPEIVRPSTRAATPPRAVFARRADFGDSARVRRGGNAPIVLQLGAFTTAQNAERAWANAERRYGLVGARAMTTTIEVGGRRLHRVSIAGFASRGEAVQLCGTIRARGGACFVRATAGDSPVRWASRATRGPRRG